MFGKYILGWNEEQGDTAGSGRVFIGDVRRFSDEVVFSECNSKNELLNMWRWF